jgi:hypothetical protein
MPGPGSVQMTDADDYIEILSSEGEDCQDDGSDQAGSMSGGSDEYAYSSDDASDGLENDRPVSTSERKAPYRIIDSEALKQVQVGSCFSGQIICFSLGVQAWCADA